MTCASRGIARKDCREFHWQSTKVEEFFSYDNVLACIHSAMRCVHNGLSYIARDQAVISARKAQIFCPYGRVLVLLSDLHVCGSYIILMS